MPFAGGRRGVYGADGLMDFLDAILDPAHKEHRAMFVRYGVPFDRSGSTSRGSASASRMRRGAARSPATGVERVSRSDDCNALSIRWHTFG